MRRLTRLCATLALALAGSGQLAASAGFVLGVGTHAGDGRDRSEAIIAGLDGLEGVAIRDSLFWSRVEDRDGFHDAPEMDHLDRLVASVAGAGGQVLLVLAYGNREAGSVGFPDSAGERAAFVRYVRWVVGRYRGRVRFFEVWNEWNAGMGSGKKPPVRGGATDYVKLLADVHAAIKADAPEAVVLAGAIEGLDTEWLRAMMAAGAGQYMDGLSVHPYVHAKGEAGTPERSMAWLDQAWNLVSGDDAFNGKSIYVTEIGWPSVHRAAGVGRTRASDYLVRFVALARTRPWIGGVWWYELRDGGPNPMSREHSFGLTRRSGQPWPAHDAVGRLARLLRNYPDWQLQADRDKTMVALSGAADGSRCAVFWPPDGSRLEVVVGAGGDAPQRVLGRAPVSRQADGTRRLVGVGGVEAWCATQAPVTVRVPASGSSDRLAGGQPGAPRGGSR